jgi:hypothetical protein
LSRSADLGGFYQYLLVGVQGSRATIDVISPEALEQRRISGNDGFEPRAEIEIVNISHANLAIDNLPFLMPATGADKYRVRAVRVDNYGRKIEQPARIARVTDNGDGTASVSVSAALPGNGYLRVTVEADLDD